MESVSSRNRLSIGNIFFASLLILALSGCQKNNELGIQAKFSYQYKNDNTVQFTNESTGDYYSLTWDFGNGNSETTTEKKKIQEVYYPLAGDYEVSLKILDFSGNTNTAAQTLTIANTDLKVQFTAEPDANDPNKIVLTNTSLGTFDGSKWIYRHKEVENTNVHEAYFPFTGSYAVELQVYKNNDTTSVFQNVTITQDDPDYFSKLTLSWADEFIGTDVSTSSWTFETGATGWGNNELQNYTNGDNAEIVNGILRLTARKVDENKVPGSYTSTRMITENKHEFQYGRFEIRAKLPSGTGIWPAIWMLGSDFRTVGWPTCGEIDIMEYVGYEPDVVHSTVHTLSGYGGNGNGSSITLATAEEEFHIYGLFWTEKKIVFYVDTPDNVIHTYAPSSQTDNTWPFNQSFFFILNVAVGGTWGGAQGIDNSIFPQTMEIDYVRVYQE